MSDRRIGIVVLHWRGMVDTRECLESLTHLDQPGGDVIVVTNGPGDFDEAAARDACPGITVIASATNGGYAAGRNIGARAAIARGADVVLLLNNDTTVAPDLASRLASALDAHPRVGIAGPVVTYYDDPGLIWSAGGTLRRTLGYTRHVLFRSRGRPSGDAQVDYVSGCAIAIRRGVFEHAGGLDERYFHYFEDLDICERARGFGYQSMTVAAASVRHKISAAAGERGSNRLNARQSYYFTRNRMVFIRRNGHGVLRWTALVSQAALLFPYEIAKAILARNWREVRGRAVGLIDGVRGRSGQRDVTP